MYLRFHHLRQLEYLNKRYKVWRPFSTDPVVPAAKIPFTTLYRHPDLSKFFLTMIGKEQKAFLVDGFNKDPHAQNLKDYVGVNGEFIDEYVSGRVDLFKQMLLFNPSRPISVGYNPDEICECCKLKTIGGKHGKHCDDAYGSYYDFLFDEALKGINEPWDMARILNPSPEYQTSIGFLREITATNVLGNRIKEVAADFAVKREIMTDYDFFQEDRTVGILKVYPQYLGKERY